MALISFSAGLLSLTVMAKSAVQDDKALVKAVAKLTADARLAAKKGDWGRSVAQLEAALHRARERAPLEVRKAVVSLVPHGGLGVYREAPGGRVDGRDVALYVEVANLGHKERLTEPGRFMVSLKVSANFTYEDGTVLGERDLGHHAYETHAQPGVVSFGLDVGLSEKAPPGRYDLVLKVEDLISKKSATQPVFFILK